ncbi:MAG: hypothetical protein ACXAC7_11570 [Candidatus Hodarchaeales archaeon]|jgi:uncharacterized protein YlzI (FlbEa/FlbD family)
MPICEKCSQPYHSSLDKCPNCFEDYEKQNQENLVNNNIPEFENIILKPTKLPSSNYLIFSGIAIFIGSIMVQLIAFWSFTGVFVEGDNSVEIGDISGMLGNATENYFLGIMWIVILALFMGYFFGVGTVLSGILVINENYSLAEYLGWIESIIEINDDGISKFKYYSHEQIIKIPWNNIDGIHSAESDIMITLKRPIKESTLELINTKKYISKEEIKEFEQKLKYNLINKTTAKTKK